jgi:hypothetical protein
MRFSNPGVRLVAAATIASVLLCPPMASQAAATGGDTAQRAVWTPKKQHFVFQGCTTYYSCDGLRDQVRKALLQLGVRKDLRVKEGACSGPGGGPEPFLNVDVEMNVLEPVHDADVDPPANVVPAHWKTVDLRLDRDPLWRAEDCELLEQIRHSFLPLFTTRDVDYHSNCVPHQVSPGGTWLHAEVLEADLKDDSKPLAAESSARVTHFVSTAGDCRQLPNLDCRH